jgi:hypothetical protein
MNASIRDKDQAHVLTNEAIEVHLLHLRSGLDGVQAALPVLRDKIDQLSVTVDSKIEKTRDAIDKADERRAAGDAALGARIEKLTDVVAEVRSYQKALFWVISLAGTGAAVVSIARAFDWI